MKMKNRTAFPSRMAARLALLLSAGIAQASAPYSGTPAAIPGTIETEDYDLGGEGDAYHDVDAGNNGNGTHRTDGVDHEVCSEGGFNVGWTVAGEWLKYTVNVASNGSYTMTARVASAVATGAFHIEVNDVDVTGTISVGNTGGWQTWVDKTAVVSLTAGTNVVKLVIEGNDMNINWIDFAYNGPPPAAPTGLQVDTVGTNSVGLGWTAAPGSPTGYNVKRAATSNGTYTVVGTTVAPTASFIDSVTGGATYYYVVSALTTGGESANSSFVSATPILGVPGAPAGLSATPGDNQVALGWTAPAVGNPTSYNVKRSTTSGSGYVDITTPGAQTTTSYMDATAVNGTTYYYVVSAVNAAGEGANSTQVDATPATYTGIYEPFDYPVDNNLLSGTAATAAGFGTWNNGVPGWVLAGLSYPGLPVANHAMRSPSGRQSVSIDTPISSGTKWISYLWSHSAGDPGGNKNGVYFLNGGTGLYLGVGYPATATEGTFGLASINTVGTAVDGSPTTLTNTALAYPYGGTKLIVLKIEFNTSGNNDTVTVYVNPTANQGTPGVAPSAVYSAFDVGTISGIGMQVSGGGDFITDEFRIAETYAEVVDAVVDPPDAPTGLMATAGSNLVSLSWTAATGDPISYNVKRSTHSGGPYTNIVGTTTEPTVVYDDAVLGGQTYYYVVSAVNGIGEGSNSAYASAAPILAPPAAVTGLMVVPGDAQVALSWGASAFATRYDVKRATRIGGPYASVGTTGSTTFDDTTAANSTTYYYVVAAIGTGGTSPETPPESATPFGPLPLVLDIAPGVGISWFASNGTTYQVQWAGEDLGTNTVWNNLGSTISGNGATNTVFDQTGSPHHYYQVQSIE